MNHPTFVVLAAGMSTRFGRLKQVEPMGPAGESIMLYNLYDAARAGFVEAVFVVRPEIEAEVVAHVEQTVDGHFPVRYVHQTLDRLPDGYWAPPDRGAPWGTGQAILCAVEAITGPFAVCNADDFYGSDAIRQLHGHLSTDPLPTEAVLVGYTLADTLSTSGGVARGICVLARDQLLDSVSEVRQIQTRDGWISGETDDGDIIELSGSEVVSMNLWGFSDPVVKLLRGQFRRFLDMKGGDPTAEFPLSSAISEQVLTGTIRVKVLHGPSDWFGVTHLADRPAAQAILRKRVEGGLYPHDLREAFQRLGDPD